REQPHGRGVQVRDLAEVRVGVDREVDVTVEIVGGAEVSAPLHPGDDARYRLHRAYAVPRGGHPEGRQVLAAQGGLPHGEGRPVDVVALRPLQQRVVDVRDVLDVVNLPLGVEPHALHEVERVVRRRVPDVGRVVRGDAAHVDAGDGAGVEGDGSTGRGVVD